jgi:hypothetical protein
MAARTTAAVSFAIVFIFGVGCSWRGAGPNGSSRGGCADNVSSCGAVLTLSNCSLARLLEQAFFLGFRPRLLGIQLTGGLARTVARQIDTRPKVPHATYGNPGVTSVSWNFHAVQANTFGRVLNSYPDAEHYVDL